MPTTAMACSTASRTIPYLLFADIHEDGRYLYPGTGAASETGVGRAKGTKLNLPLPPGAGDAEFHRAWDRIETYLEKPEPEFILFQCGADSLEGDPITHLRLTEEAHAHAAARLCALAKRSAQGRRAGDGRRRLQPAQSRPSLDPCRALAGRVRLINCRCLP